MKANQSFSLIEVLVFISILSLFFIMAVTITTFSIRNMKIQQYKILATRYAEEANEWVKQEKEDDWPIFTSRDNSSSGSGTNYCLNTLDWETESDCLTWYTLGPPYIFKRVLIITNSGNPVDRVIYNITVSWLDNNVVQSVVLKSVLNLWE